MTVVYVVDQTGSPTAGPFESEWKAREYAAAKGNGLVVVPFSSVERPAVAWKLQEITVDGAPILPTLYPTKAEAMTAGKAEGERVGHLPHCVDWLCRIDVIWAGRTYREDRFTAWSATQAREGS